MASGLQILGRVLTWRRAILLVAVVGVSLALGRREERLSAWLARVDAGATILLDDLAADAGSPRTDVMVQAAWEALSDLDRPWSRQPAVRPEDGDPLVARVTVTGSNGRQVEMTWSGEPPRLTRVDRSAAVVESEFAEINDGSSSNDGGVAER